MTDYGFAPLPGTNPHDPNNQYVMLRRLFELRSGTALVHQPPATTVQEFVQLLENSPNVDRPIDFALLGTHANRVGMELPLYRGQPTVVSRLSGYEAAAAAAADPTTPVAFPSALFNPDLPNFIHIKGCNIGQSVPLLEKFKEAFGNHVEVTAPKHYHGIYSVPEGIYEFMAREFRISRPTNFGSPAEAVAAFTDAKFKFYDDMTPVPDDRWGAWIPPTINNTRQLRPLPRFPLGVQIGNRTTLDLNPAVRFRVDRTPFTWTINYPDTEFPNPADYQQAFFDHLEDQDVFQASHDFPLFVRYGFDSLSEFIAGYNWTKVAPRRVRAPPPAPPGISKLLVTGTRTVYTAQVPITDVVTGNLVFNFYPAPGSQLLPVVRLVENDPDFFATV